MPKLEPKLAAAVIAVVVEAAQDMTGAVAVEVTSSQVRLTLQLQPRMRGKVL